MIYIVTHLICPTCVKPLATATHPTLITSSFFLKCVGAVLKGSVDGLL